MGPSDDDGRSVDRRVLRTRNDVLRVALDVLIDEGRDAVTHQHLAEVAGYSRATLYNHWPTRTDLLADAFSRLGGLPHHTPTGDVRADLVQELVMFRYGMQRLRLDRALAELAGLAASIPRMAAVRDQLVTDGERVVRQLLATVLAGAELEAAALMLSGAILDSALMHGELPADEVITASVDLVLRAAAGGPTG